MKDGTARGLRACFAVLALAGTLGACDSLLNVDPPGEIPAGELEDPGNAALLVRSAVGDFECALGAYAAMSGLIGEELADATQTADRYPYDRRQIGPGDRRYSTFECDALGVYVPLNRARASADNAVLRLESWTDAEVPGRSALIARASAYAGYSLVLLGEGFCTATISTSDLAGNITYGTEMSRAQILAAAEQRFTRALAEPGIARQMRNLALLGRARARLDLGRYADARADAAAVDSGFVENATASGTTPRRQNRVWAQAGAGNNLASVDSFYRSLNDPRVPVFDKGTTSALGLALWGQGKFASAASPIPVARWEEARLIVAEADARAGNLGSAIEIVNRFRAKGGQAALPSDATQGEVLAAIIDQRRRELFLEGHHLGDLIRFNLPFRPAVGQPYLGGGTYGQSLCMPLPDVERINNPNID